MLIDIDDENDIIGAECLGFFLGVPQIRTVCSGVLTGTDFKVSDAPIYPKAGMGVLPTKDDIIAYSRATTAGVGGEPDTYVDTPVTIAELVESETFEGLFEGFTLGAVPAGADAVVADYAEMLEPFIAQGVTPKLTQKADEINRINSTNTKTAYGNITIAITQEQIMSRNTIQYIRKLMFTPYYGTKTPVTGYKTYDLRARPVKLYGYENIRWDDDLIARLYFEDVTIAPDLPSAKAKDQVGFTLAMNVAKLPTLVLPDV